MRTQEFLHALWGGDPPGAIQLWRLADKRAIYPRSLRAAAAVADNHTDIYTCVALCHPQRARENRGRPTAAHAIALAGMWLDIDINGGPTDKTGGAPDRQAALDAAHAIITPTILIDSGHGVHAWYLYDHPWRFTSSQDQTAAAVTAAQFQQLHRQHTTRHGWGLDSTHDLARLMRLPGTLNGKSTPPTPVKILALNMQARYPRQTIRQIASDAGPIHHAAPAEPGGVQVVAGRQAPEPMLQALLEDPEIAATFNHYPPRPGWSLSEYDLSLASQLARSSMTDQQIADVLCAHRARHGEHEKVLRPASPGRMSYLEATIAKARAGVAARQPERRAA